MKKFIVITICRNEVEVDATFDDLAAAERHALHLRGAAPDNPIFFGNTAKVVMVEF